MRRHRNRLVALITAIAFSCASTGSALARTPVATAVQQQHGLPAPTPLNLAPVAPVEAPLQPSASQMAAPVDVPIRIPAHQKVTVGKVLLVLLAIVGLVVLLAIGFVLFALFDLTSDQV